MVYTFSTLCYVVGDRSFIMYIKYREKLQLYVCVSGGKKC